MKIISKIFFLQSVFLLNCSISLCQGQTCFENYISTIEEISLPMFINENSFDNDNFKNHIDTNCLYFFYDSLPRGYRYYCVSKFSSDKIIGLIINQKGSAGGIEERFYLFLFNFEGTLLNNFLLGQIVADCSLTIEEKSIIRKDLTIQKTIVSNEVECDTEVEISEKCDTVHYQINNINGSIDIIR